MRPIDLKDIRLDTLRTDSARIDLGRDVLKVGDYEAAERIFREGLELAEGRGDERWQASYQFNLGLTLQARDRASEASLREAEQQYLQYLEMEPASGAALNNLAQIYADTGQDDAARKYFELAIENGSEDRKAFYALNYGGFLEAEGDLAAALKYYELARREQSRAPEIHAGLVRTYLATRPAALSQYLWQLLSEGQQMRALETALDVLVDSPSLSLPLQEELLTAAVVGLSEYYYDPGSLPDRPAGTRLERLVQDASPVAQGAEEILRLHTVDVLELPPYSFPWWSRRADPFQDPGPGVWPRDGFRSLVRALGDWYRDYEDVERAAAYYRLGADLPWPDFPHPDPLSVLRLVDLYLSLGHRDSVDAILNDYAVSLYDGKGRAYRQSEWEKVFEYHRTLGTIYAILEQWGDSGEVASAIFQLEHARAAVGRYEEVYSGARESQIRFEPRLVEFLATAYDATGRPLDAFRLRLDSATDFLNTGERDDVRRVLDPIESEGLPVGVTTRDRERYDALRQRLDLN